jgi:hypothetical protein
MKFRIEIVVFFTIGILLVTPQAFAKPWGAMYTPNENLTYKGMSGTVKYYRGVGGANALLRDLAFAESCGVKLILTLGNTSPLAYLDENGHINMSKVHEELDPFFDIAEDVQPYIDNGTVWGIRFMDEPHDPPGVDKVNETELGEVYALIKSYFKNVSVGSTAPAWYMVNVPNSDYAFGQYNHDNANKTPEEFFDEEIRLAHGHGLLYVASLNSNMNSVDNRTFFTTYITMCKMDTDFVTSWMWPQGRYPQPSFEKRFNDPEVQDLIPDVVYYCNGIVGDFNLNGRVDIGDASYVAGIVVGCVKNDLKADLNGNGRVDIGDLAKITYFLLGKIDHL